MKLSNIIWIGLLMTCWLSCSNCEELVLEPCDTENSIDCGMTVATCYADEVGEVAVIYDTRRMSDAPRGADWSSSAPTVSATHPSNWTANDLGQVFGIAIDSRENIYLASSDIYAYDGSGTFWTSGNTSRPFSPTQVFKCSPPSYNAVPFFNLPVLFGNETLPLNGTGNIAYDQWNDQFFVTNIDNGYIYRVDINGLIQESYDPWGTSAATSGAIVNQSERPWGVNVNNENGDVKVYFPRVNNGNREIYSLTLNAGAFPPPNSEVVEISGFRGTSPIVSDIAFSGDNTKMLIAERGDPHFALVQSYDLVNGNWAFNTSYFVGDNAGGDGENSAGGVDFYYQNATDTQEEQCDEAFWASGNYMNIGNNGNNRYYGIQGIDYAGNNSSSAPAPSGNKDTDVFIDFDGVPGTEVKRTIGDVEVFNCARCDDPCELESF